MDRHRDTTSRRGLAGATSDLSHRSPRHASTTEGAQGTGRPATVVFVALDGLQSLDLFGPYEVFAGANQYLRALPRAGTHPGYDVVTASLDGRPVRTESGASIVADFDLASLASETAAPIDTLVIPGGAGVRQSADDPRATDQIRRLGQRATRVATICTGAFVAASCGLADGRRIATHWAYAERLASAFPELTVDPDAIWVRDGNLWSSAGVTAGIDLALAMVEHDLGAAPAQEIARWLVMFLRRPGGQSQFAAPVWRPPAGNPCVRHAQELIAADPADDHGIERLAARVGLSSRHLARRFIAEVGESPGRYVERIRVDTARALLESTGDSLPDIARRCGFGSPETFRRAFLRTVGVPPDTYRRRFRL